MKKYLIKGLLALVVGGFTASCADKDGDYVPVGQQKATAYADAFKELIGGEVAPNHDWGFTKTSLVDETAQARANTRGSEPNQTVWPDYGWPTKPGELKATTPSGKSEEQIVTEWFQNHTIADAVTLDCNNYWVLQVHYKDYNYTVNQHEFEKYENGQEVWKTGTQTVNPKGHMDQIYANKDANSTSYDHIYNFNTGSGDYMLVINSETKYGFGYEESWGTSEKHVWYNSFMAHIVDEANGIDGYYVGFDYQTYKDKDVSYQYWDGTQTISGTTTNWALNPDGVYDDRIIKIVPGTAAREIPSGSSTSTSTRTDRVERWRLVQQGRIFCEDLGTTDITTSDIDFNDAVFDAKLWRVGQFDVYYTNNESREGDYIAGLYNNEKENGKFKYVAEILLLAAGGTMPLKIGGDDGFEIHSKFGEGQEPSRTIGHTTIINTMGQPSQANFSTTVNTDNECKAVRVFVDVTKYVVEILNPEDPEIGLDVIPIDVKWNTPDHQSVEELSDKYGQAPQKLCVPIGTRWVYERIPITPVKDENNNVVKDGAYLKFADYAKTRSPLFWNEGNIEDLLYPAIPEGMTPEAICTNKIGSNSYKDYTTTGETTTEVETVLWEGELAFAENTNGSDFTPSTLSFNKGDYIRIYGSTTNSSNNRVQIAFVDNTTKGWLTKKPYDQTNVNFTNGYVEGTLDATDISNLAGVTKFGVWGINVTITKISKVVKTRTTN